MVNVLVASPELSWLSPLSLTSVCCHKSTGWEAVQLALLSSLDGTSYLFHNDPLRLSSPSLFIFVSLSLIQTCSVITTSSPLSLHSPSTSLFSKSSCMLKRHKVWAHTQFTKHTKYYQLRRATISKSTMNRQHDCQPYRHPTICSYGLCTHI